jgi:hypothetical protein
VAAWGEAFFCPGPARACTRHFRVLRGKSTLYGGFVWARRALNSRERRLPARAVSIYDASGWGWTRPWALLAYKIVVCAITAKVTNRTFHCGLLRAVRVMALTLARAAAAKLMLKHPNARDSVSTCLLGSFATLQVPARNPAAPYRNLREMLCNVCFGNAAPPCTPPPRAPRGLLTGGSGARRGSDRGELRLELHPEPLHGRDDRGPLRLQLHGLHGALRRLLSYRTLYALLFTTAAACRILHC